MGASISVSSHFSHREHRARFQRVSHPSMPSPCGMCQENVGTGAPAMAFAYSCTDHRCAAGGFHAHPRCCDLPRDIGVPLEKHPHRLVLRSPAAGGKNSNGRQHPRRCLECQTTTNGRTAAWSYQCPKCDGVELCLACVLGDDGRAVQCCGVDLPAMSLAGQLAGAFFCGFGSVMGCPGFTTQLYTRGT